MQQKECKNRTRMNIDWYGEYAFDQNKNYFAAKIFFPKHTCEAALYRE